MCIYEVILELKNIHEIKCQITNQAISGTSHDNLVRFLAVRSFHLSLLQFNKIKTFIMTFNNIVRLYERKKKSSKQYIFRLHVMHVLVQNKFN